MAGSKTKYSGASGEIGAVLMCGISGTELLPREAEVLRRIRPAGIILFAKNFAREKPGWIDQFERLTDQIRSAVGRDRMFLAVDHEGGRVHRFPAPVTRFPAACKWRDSSAAVGTAMGRELRALGFNLAFAPVLDVHSEKTNPVIGERAFAETPDEVSRFAGPFIRALEAEGVVGCGKHFPGHGRTTTDSHHELPVLNIDKAELERVELEPFKRAIAAGLRMIMTAHVHYPQIDAEYPATLSEIILTDLLRGGLGFGGVVISDDLEMKALSSRSVEENGLTALLAGVDLLLVAHNNTVLPLEDALKVYDHLESEISRGATRRRFEQAAERVTKLLDNLPATRPGGFRADLELIGAAEHSELAAKLA